MLKFVVKQFRKVMGRLRERADVRLDDHEFEHLLLYHGLVGTSPENQRSFKDVRADIIDAVKSGSSLQLGIALKVQPLLWQDKLEKILSEIAEKSKDELVSVLLPNREGEPWPDMSDPLGHDDWRVRANAAFAIGFLNVTDARVRMIKCLHDTASSASPAYCHVAMALAKLPGEECIKALLDHVNDDEPWFRVDTAAALAQYSDARVKDILMQSMLTINPLSDYLAVVLSKRFQTLQLIDEERDSNRKAGCQMISGLTDAANQTFSPDVLQDLDLELCAAKLNAMADSKADVFTLRAMSGLINIWLEKASSLDVADAGHMQEEVDKLSQRLKSEASTAQIEKTLAAYAGKSNTTTEVELLNAIQLSGRLKLAPMVPHLLNLLKSESQLREEIVLALGTTCDASAAPALIDLASKLYKLEERTGPSISSVPVVEDDVEKSKLYWRTLQALGNLPSKATNEFLFLVASDFAPDKRQQVMESLHDLHASFDKNERQQFEELIKSGLDDPSASVKASSLKGVSALNAVQFLDKVLKMSDSQEPSISRQALSTLGSLSRTRNETVLKAIKDKLNAETDEKRKRRLAAVIQGQT